MHNSASDEFHGAIQPLAASLNRSLVLITMKSSPLLIAQDLKEPLPEENLAEKLSTAENDFETNKTIYESLTTNLCKEQYTTIGWIESLMSYNAVGMTAVVPGGALCSVDKFGMKSEAVLNGVSRVLAEFVKQVGFEKSDGSVIPRFSPRLYDYVVASSIAEKWVNTQCFVLGVDALEHVVLCWHDDAVPGVGECVKALRAVCAADGEFVRKVKHVTLSNATEQSIRQCMIEGGKPDAAILPALEMFTCKGEGLRAQCAKLRIPIIVDNVLLGGLVDERYLRMRTPPDLATLRGTAAFDSLGVICNVVGGWERFQGILSALEDTKHGVANAAIEYFIGAGMRCIVETILDGPPWFMLGGDSLLEADRENITAALRAYAALG